MSEQTPNASNRASLVRYTVPDTARAIVEISVIGANGLPTWAANPVFSARHDDQVTTYASAERPRRKRKLALHRLDPQVVING